MISKLKSDYLNSDLIIENLFSNSKDVIMFIDFETGEILKVNEVALNLYGYTYEELTSITIYDFIITETQTLLSAQMKLDLEKGIVFETVHTKKDGTKFPVELSSVNVGNEENKLLFVIIRDISLRERYKEIDRIILENIPVSIFITVDNKIEFVNKAGLHLLEEKDKTNLIGKNLRDYSRPQYKEFLYASKKAMRKMIR